VSDNKTPIDAALDLLFFAPVGFALSVRELVPKLADRGRQQITGQVTMAKMVGEFAVKAGAQEAEKVVGRVRTQAESVVGGVTGGAARTAPTNGSSAATATATAPAPTAAPAAPKPAKPAPKPAAAAEAAPSAVVDAPDGAPSGAATIDVYGRPQETVPDVGSLAIPGYDTLSASQVVQRLAGLAKDELEAVRVYEESSRGRKTILHKVDQLTAGANGSSSS
jgi:hypothetical protein